MKRPLIAFVLLLGVLAGCSRQALTPSPRAEENHVRALPGRAEILLTEQAAETVRTERFLGQTAPLGVLSVERVFPDAGEFEARHRAAGLHRWYRVRYDTEVPLTRAQAGLASIEGVESVSFPRRKARRSYFNDPLAMYQWHYSNDGTLDGNFKKGIDINVEPVWREFTAGSSEVVVAVIDGGIHIGHEDLKGVVLAGGARGSRNFVAGYGADDIPADNHGTHVGGTIGAINNNRTGLCGIAGGKDGRGGVRLMSCVIFADDEEEDSTGDEDAQALVWAADNGAVIANNSWGYVAESDRDAARIAQEFLANDSPTKDAIDYFIDYAGTDASGRQTGPMKGGVVFFASGNDGFSHDAPSEYGRVVAVSAFEPDGRMADYSNYGPWVDILAPGGRDSEYDEEGIASTGVSNPYIYYTGTSMACPHVSGVAALLVSYFGGPGFTNDELLEMLLGGARQGIIKIPSGRTVGGGMLDAYGAFTYRSGGDEHPDIRFSTDYRGDYRFRSHESVTLDWTIIGNEKSRLQVSVESDCPGLTSDCGPSQVRMTINALQALPGDYLATIRVGNAASLDVPFTILENHAPTRIARFGDQIINVASDAPLSFNLDDYFSDPDGETLSYRVVLSGEEVAVPSVSGGTLSLSPAEYGLAEVTVTAYDARRAGTSSTFRLLGRNAYQDLDIYPNPVKDYLYLRPGLDKTLDITLYNQAGVQVWSATGVPAGPFDPLSIDLRDQSGGTYSLYVGDRRYTIAKQYGLLGSAQEVEDLGGNLLLTTLVVFEGKFAEQFLGIVARGLHRDGPGGVLRRGGIQHGGVELQHQHLRQQLRHQRLSVRFEDKVVIDRNFGGGVRGRRGGRSRNWFFGKLVRKIISVRPLGSLRRHTEWQVLLRDRLLPRGRNEAVVHQHHAGKLPGKVALRQGTRQAGGFLVRRMADDVVEIARLGVPGTAQGLRHLAAHRNHLHLALAGADRLQRLPHHIRIESPAERRIRSDRHNCRCALIRGHIPRPPCALKPFPTLLRKVPGRAVR